MTFLLLLYLLSSFFQRGDKIIWSFPYEKFRENGRIVFDNLYDGATCSNTVFGNVKELYARDLKLAEERKNLADRQ